MKHLHGILLVALSTAGLACNRTEVPVPPAAPAPVVQPAPVVEPAPAAQPAPIAATATATTPQAVAGPVIHMPVKPEVAQEDGTVVLRGHGEKKQFAVEVRFRKPKVGELFTAQTKIFDVATGASATGAKFVLDATMPEHGHGMATQPIHIETTPGVWRSEGMRLHMHGHWVFSASVEIGERKDIVKFSWEQDPAVAP